jgi:serine/threonine protein kinase
MSDTKSGTDASGTRPPDSAVASKESPDLLGPESNDPIDPRPAANAGLPEPANDPDLDDDQDTVISKQPPIPEANDPRPFSPIEMGVALQGQQLGHFQLEKFVGGGGMGAVFRARDTSLDRIVAVKVLSRDQADPDIHRRFRNEAQSAARLDHDNISRVFYEGQDKGWNYIVFEFVDGLNIRDIVATKGPLPVAEAISYTLQVAEALEHAFRRDVVHRDIKPSNVLITSSGHVKLVDMGLARLHQVETHESDLTASGVTLGTFDYISPEQARDPRTADVRSDLYSLGCTLYFMLTGRAPFPDGTVLQKLLSHTSDERPDPRLYRPGLPEEIAEILNKLLARRPEQRYQQPNELIGELLLVSDHLGIPNAGQGSRVWVTRSERKPNWVERLAPIVLPLLLLLLGVWGMDKFFDRTEEKSIEGRQRYLKPGTNNEQTQRSTPKSPATNNVPPPLRNDQSAVDSLRHDDAEKPKGPVKETTLDHAERKQDYELIVPSKPPGVEANPNGLGEAFASATQTRVNDETSAEISLPSSEGSLTEQVAADAKLDGNDVFVGVEAKRPSISPDDVRRLVVAEQEPLELASNAAYCGTFGQAVKSLDKFPNLEIVELRFNGRVYETPFQITASDLTIQAGEGYKPILAFEPGATELAAGGQMIQLVRGNISWIGVQLEMTLPDEASSGGWSLFELNQVTSLSLRHSSMTIRNAHEDGSSRHPSVAFFRVSIPSSHKMMAMPGEPAPMRITPVIELRNCVARGEATLIRMPEVTPIRLGWNQGLLATNERLIEAHGTAKIADRDRPIEIDLIHVTAALPQGMCRFVGATDAQDQPPLDVECTACIFLCTSEVPLIEHTGVRDVSDVKSGWLNYRGDNFYPTFDGVEGLTCWRIAPLEQPEDEVVLTSVDTDKSWWDGTIQSRVIWENTPTTRSMFHLHLPQDYSLVDELRNLPVQFAKEHSDAGFDIDLLPTFFVKPSISPADAPTVDDADMSID